jgi:natural product biosynthesis luciferase-like monooxygenase protein
MEFGVFSLPTYYPDVYGSQGEFLRDLVDYLASAEDLGFDAIWINEHHFHPFGGLIPAPPVMLATLAQRTRRVRLGTSVLVLPLHHPIELAEQLAMIDLLSGGRLDLGIGRGFVLYDYEVLGVSYETAEERSRESLDVILKAWSGERFTYQGQHYPLPVAAQVWPQPQQSPHPPIWIACATSPASFERTARLGYGLLTVAYIKPLDRLKELVQVYRDTWQAEGHDPAAYRHATHLQAVVHEDGDQARAIAHDALHRYLELNLEAQGLASNRFIADQIRASMENLDVDAIIAQGRLVAGTPDECVRLLERARDELWLTGVDLTFLFGGIPFAQARHSMQLFAREVMPRLRAPALAHG